jgi:hypothetical protein
MEPYAVHLLRRLKAGESVDQLVVSEGIQRERIVTRLRAALRYAERAEGRLTVEGIPPERLREHVCREFGARWLPGPAARPTPDLVA